MERLLERPAITVPMPVLFRRQPPPPPRPATPPREEAATNAAEAAEAVTDVAAVATAAAEAAMVAQIAAAAVAANAANAAEAAETAAAAIATVAAMAENSAKAAATARTATAAGAVSQPPVIYSGVVDAVGIDHGFASAVGALVHRSQPTSAAAAATNDWRGGSAAPWQPKTSPPDCVRGTPSVEDSPSAAPIASPATTAPAISRGGLTMQSEAAYANGAVETDASGAEGTEEATGIGNQSDGEKMMSGEVPAFCQP